MPYETPEPTPIATHALPRRSLVAVILLSALLGGGLPPASGSHLAAAQGGCAFQAGFAALRDLIPAIVGDCVTDEWHNPDNGDALQETTGGLLVWRKADNWTAFTDGTTTWINGPYGLASRPNDTAFDWEGGPAEPPAAASGVGPAASAAQPIPGREYPLAVDRSSIAARPEIRPANSAANGTVGGRNDPAKFRGPSTWRPYYERISGDFTGTTEEILEWAARKWGFDGLGYPDLAKAVAWQETKWDQASRGDNQADRYCGTGPAPSFCWPADFQSYGITQVKRTVWPDSFPRSRESTAYAADYTMAVIRSFYDGAQHLRDGTRGNLRHATAVWFSGRGEDGNSDYARRVFGFYDSKPWTRER